MPLATQPGREYPIVMPSDRNVTPAPTFYCRHLNADEYAAAADVNDALEKCASTAEYVGQMKQVLHMALTRWEHVTDVNGRELEFCEASFGKALDPVEMRLLTAEILKAQRAGYDDLKNFVSPPPSAGEDSADDVTASPAKTGPAAPSPPSLIAQSAKTPSATTAPTADGEAPSS